MARYERGTSLPAIPTLERLLRACGRSLVLASSRAASPPTTAVRGSLGPRAALLSSWGGQRSPPTLLHRDLWPALAALSGDVGARAVLAGRDDVEVLEVDERLGSLEDVDRPEDLARLSAR